MTVGLGGYERVRAWVLVQADDPNKVARRLYELDSAGGDEYVVVRADVVDYSHNIVLPVDAESDDALMIVVAKIEDIQGVETTTVLRVTEHVPYPPHVANGWIDESELAAQEEQEIRIEAALKPGRQGESPGLNAWG